jgi:hypothetical protein
MTLGAVLVLALLVLLVLGKGSLGRLGLAWQTFGRVLGSADTAGRVQSALEPPPPPKPVKRSGEALRLLALLQREGRLVDFFMQDIQGATDEQIGVFVRELHRKGSAVLKSHVEIEPVLPQEEETTVEVPRGFDPSAIRLSGNLSGPPPYKGTLKHAGWRARDFNVPAPPEGQDELVLAPAEVDVP